MNRVMKMQACTIQAGICNVAMPVQKDRMEVYHNMSHAPSLRHFLLQCTSFSKLFVLLYALPSAGLICS